MSRNQKYAEQKKPKKKKEDFFTSPEDRMYITVSLCLVSNERQTYL